LRLPGGASAIDAWWAANRLQKAYIVDFRPMCAGHRGPRIGREKGRMDRVLSITLGVVIARDRIDHPWQEHAWRPVSVFLNAPEASEWRELRREEKSVHYHAATMALELHAKETIGYRANLETGWGDDVRLLAVFILEQREA